MSSIRDTARKAGVDARYRMHDVKRRAEVAAEVDCGLQYSRIIVKNGHLTLEGVVNNEADKNVVKLRAKGVHGVFSVPNNLRVEK